MKLDRWYPRQADIAELLAIASYRCYDAREASPPRAEQPPTCCNALHYPPNRRMRGASADMVWLVALMREGPERGLQSPVHGFDSVSASQLSRLRAVVRISALLCSLVRFTARAWLVGLGNAPAMRSRPFACAHCAWRGVTGA